MTAVFCFSGSGHSLAVAEFATETLGCPVHLIDPLAAVSAETIDTAVIVFPVYCQNIPGPAKDFLKDLKAKNLVLLATYGKISWGNVLWEAKKLVSGRVIAGACIPMGHTFLNGTCEFDKEAFRPIFHRIREPKEAEIPRRGKNLLANFLPAWRSRIAVKIRRSDACTHCNLCGRNCPMQAIENGIPNSKCIRCLRCVANCPQKALSFENSTLLEKYLSQKRRAKEIEIYL